MKIQKRIAAVHDISCVGRCSLTVALPVLSAAGFDTGILPTAVLSTHTGGFEDFTYRDLTSDIEPIASHWKSLGLRFDAFYSGFLGSYDQIEIVSNLFESFRDSQTLIMMDPVMADHGEMYSVYSREMAKGMKKLCAKADIIVPNLTEAAFLLDEEYVGKNYDRKYIEDLLVRLSDLGPEKVVLTGVSYDDERLGAVCYDRSTGSIDYAFNGKNPEIFHGTGDVFASSLLAGVMHGFSLAESAQIAVDYTYECIKLTESMNQEKRYGVCFEMAIPYLIKRLGLI